MWYAYICQPDGRCDTPGRHNRKLRMIVFGADSRTVNAPGYAKPYAYMGRGAMAV